MIGLHTNHSDLVVGESLSLDDTVIISPTECNSFFAAVKSFDLNSAISDNFALNAKNSNILIHCPQHSTFHLVTADLDDLLSKQFPGQFFSKEDIDEISRRHRRKKRQVDRDVCCKT